MLITLTASGLNLLDNPETNGNFNAGLDSKIVEPLTILKN